MWSFNNNIIMRYGLGISSFPSIFPFISSLHSNYHILSSNYLILWQLHQISPYSLHTTHLLIHTAVISIKHTNIPTHQISSISILYYSIGCLLLLYYPLFSLSLFLVLSIIYSSYSILFYHIMLFYAIYYPSLNLNNR